MKFETKVLLLPLFVIFLLSTSLVTGQVIEGSNAYVSYHEGNLPIVISVPHGGGLMPVEIPNRTCQSAVWAQDAFTLELAQRIDSSFFEWTGCRPHIIYSNLHRRKLDPNRNLSAGACGNPDAVLAWEEFHGFIETAQEAASEAHDGEVFFLDLHGHGNAIQRIELGYLLFDDELELPDATLNGPTYVGYSSIQNLVANNAGNLSHAALLRGPQALGTLLGNRGFPSVPSEQIPAPGTSSNYFSGGYITANHTSYAIGNNVNGVQVECNYDGVRDNAANRHAFADTLVHIMIDFMNLHYAMPNLNCEALAVDDFAERMQHAMRLYPNPAQREVRIELPRSGSGTFQVSIVDLQGKVCFEASSLRRETGVTIDLTELPSGMYAARASWDGGYAVEKLILY
jgi:hypothetical protein